MSQAINITKGNDHRLRVTMTRWSEPMALSSSSNVHAYAVKSLTGVRSALIVRYSSQDEGVMELDWPATLTAGCYGLEITGELDGEGQWRMAAANAVKVTQVTEKGGESITMTGDSFDVVGVVTVCVGSTGVTEELRQVIADMIEEEYNASERLREEGESAREAHEDNRILAEEAREGNEQTREMAEVERQRNTQQAIADAAGATAAANNAAAAANTAAANAKADYVGSDNYVYRWVEATQEYVKTNLYVKGDKGDPGTTDYNDLQNKPDLSAFVTKSVDDLLYYYLKSETYTKAEVQALVNAVKQFTYEAVPTLPAATADTMHKIYLVPSSDPQAQNVKDEFITIDNGTEAQTRYAWEQIGSTAIDLSGYVTTTALNTALADYTTTAQLTLLLAGKQDVINDLAEIRSGAALGATALQSETDPTVPQWAKQSTKPSYTPEEVGALPANTPLFDGDYNSLTHKPDLSGFITISVNNLVNYYLKSDVYTKTEVANLIAAIQQFHYEIYASISAVTSPAGNVLYLIGPTGTGADKYEEYVYDSTKQEPWVKIGDTSIDLSDYYTKSQTDNVITQALNAALANYTTTNALTLLLAGKQDSLVSGTNIKTINNQSILGAGNINIQGSYTPTLQSAPTSSTTTYTKDGQTVDFEIGQFVRVSNQNNPAGYDMYQLYDLTTENNATTAVWRSMDIVIGDINSVLDNINGEVI